MQQHQLHVTQLDCNYTCHKQQHEH